MSGDGGVARGLDPRRTAGEEIITKIKQEWWSRWTDPEQDTLRQVSLGWNDMICLFIALGETEGGFKAVDYIKLGDHVLGVGEVWVKLNYVPEIPDGMLVWG